MSAAPLIAVAVATLLFAVALLHLFWGVGGAWPGRDKDDLVRKVMGGPPDMKRPGTPFSWFLACLAVAMISAVGGLLALSLGELLPSNLPYNQVRALALVGGAILALRGVAGFFEERLRPVIRGGPYAKLNVRIYSPLCLALGAGLLFLALR